MTEDERRDSTVLVRLSRAEYTALTNKAQAWIEQQNKKLVGAGKRPSMQLGLGSYAREVLIRHLRR